MRLVKKVFSTAA